MNVRVARGIQSAAGARGHVVVIDVLRAFTTAAYALNAGAERIVLVSSAEEAFALRASIAGSVLVGEDGGRKIPGFDHGNSPAEVERLDLAARTVVLRSSSGTQGVVSATSADALFLGSLVVARATARHVARSARTTTLLAMGSPFGTDGDEDAACADHLAALLRGESPDPRDTLARVRASDAGRQALDPAIDWISPADLECALRVDRFDFAMEARREGGLVVARRA